MFILLVNLFLVDLYAQQEILPASFSIERGLYEDAFDLVLSKSDRNSQILYTLDGSDPRSAQAKLYTGIIPIYKTTLVRAVVRARNEEYSEVITHSYIFPEDVVRQPSLPEGYPKEWGDFLEEEGKAPADYEMDREITENPIYKDSLVAALYSLPSVSLVTDKAHLFSPIDHPDSGGIYVFTNIQEGFRKLWEKPVSLEYIPNDSQKGIQLNAGLRLHGGQSRLTDKSPKHSFRLAFREEYGPKKMEYDLFGP
ncbi:MAG: chitobiase/beta-hexosaminidase C-terminal domain-containing protein, partial [Bacteroidota bacterium]